jgi:hypothetical protein
VWEREKDLAWLGLAWHCDLAFCFDLRQVYFEKGRLYHGFSWEAFGNWFSFFMACVIAQSVSALLAGMRQVLIQGERREDFSLMVVHPDAN